QQQSRLRREFLESQLQVNDSLVAAARRTLTEFQRRARSGGSAEPPGRERIELPGIELQREQLLAERRTDEDLLTALRDSGASRRAVQTALSIPGVAASPAVVQLNSQLFQYEKARDSLTTPPARSNLPASGWRNCSRSGCSLASCSAERVPSWPTTSVVRLTAERRWSISACQSSASCPAVRVTATR